MALGIGIGIGIAAPSGSGGDPTPFFEVLAENGDFLISESGAFIVIQ